MYDHHQARCVRRSDLRSLSSSSGSVSASEEVAIQWRQQLGQVYNTGLEASPTWASNRVPPGPIGRSNNQSDEGEYKFRLFSNKTKTAPTSSEQVSKVRIKSPSPGRKEPGFVCPERSEDHYFTGERANLARERYREVAIEGEHVLKEALARWPGFELPWRVTTIYTSHTPKRPNASPSDEVPGLVKKRKRSGKKKRIAIRVKTQSQTARENFVKQAEVSKEAAEREKRNRRNREKKVKRREKARAKKEGDRG